MPKSWNPGREAQGRVPESQEVSPDTWEKDVQPKETVRELKGREKVEDKKMSLVVQWLRICLPIQGTRMTSLVQEDSTDRKSVV